MDSIKIFFVLSNAEIRWAILEHTGLEYDVRRRSVEIELTDTQMKSLNIRDIGKFNDKYVYENIQSVSISLIDLNEKSIKLLFIFNDGQLKYDWYCETGIHNDVHRRAVEIELTKEQVEKINIHKISIHNITDFETIESVSLMY